MKTRIRNVLFASLLVLATAVTGCTKAEKINSGNSNAAAGKTSILYFWREPTATPGERNAKIQCKSWRMTINHKGLSQNTN